MTSYCVIQLSERKRCSPNSVPSLYFLLCFCLQFRQLKTLGRSPRVPCPGHHKRLVLLVIVVLEMLIILLCVKHMTWRVVLLLTEALNSSTAADLVLNMSAFPKRSQNGIGFRAFIVLAKYILGSVGTSPV